MARFPRPSLRSGLATRFAVIVAIVAVAVVGPLGGSTIAEEPPGPVSSDAHERDATLADLQREMAEAGRLRNEGKLEEAVAAANRVLDLERRLFGDVHPAIADTLAWLAQIEAARQRFDEAERLLQRVTEIREATLGQQHPKYLAALNNLGLLYYRTGDYARAEPVLQQALEVAGKLRGANSPDAIICLNNLAELYHARGDYARAEPLFCRALEACREVRGEGHPDCAVALNNLAGLYQSMGDFARAEPLLREALEIRKQAFGEGHHEYAASVNNLAGLYYQVDDYARAEPLFRQALQIRKQVLGTRHPDYATSLNNLAGLYESKGEPDRAEPLYREALQIRKQVLGTKHPDYAASLTNLASLLRSKGDYDRAEPLYEQALQTRKEALGTSHPDYAASLNNLAVLYRSKGDYARAEPLYRDALEIQRRILQATFAVLSERQQLAMTRRLRRTLDGYLSVTSQTGGDERPYRYVLAWKGMVFVRQRETRLASTRPELAPLAAELESASARMAALVFSRPDPAQQAAWQKRLAELSEKKDQIEAELAERGAELAATRAATTAEQLQAVLPADAALVDFLEYANSVPAGDTGSGGEAAKPLMAPHVVAFVLRPGRPVVRLSLGPAAPIGEAIDAWRATYGQAAKGAEAARELRRRVWDPLEGQLAGVRTVLVSPDGDLARVPLAALPGREPDSYLLEDYALAVVPVPQWLPEMVAETSSKGAEETAASGSGAPVSGPEEPSLLLMGDIDYDALPQSPGDDATRGLAPDRPESLRFTPLESSRGEILAVRDSFELAFAEGHVRLLRRDRATEAAFRREAPRNRSLHVATHGFFAPPEWSSFLGPAQDDGRGASQGSAGTGLGRKLSDLHPGLLSGIALAGANQAARSGADDGILTAEEVTALDLGKVDLAVLSACETGLGPVAGGEGVLGLQRAFQVSGARSVVASLWKVSDEPTRQLMERFYENLWDKKMGKLDALREAQLAMLREGSLRGMMIVSKDGQPSKPRRLPPYYWAAFVLSGDWR